jgi:DnaJ-class molecular chaperone
MSFKTPAAALNHVLAAPHHYAVLGTHRESSEAEVLLAHRALARLLHPDRCALPRAHDAMAAANVASSTLNVVKRANRYHAGLAARKGTRKCDSCAGLGATVKFVKFKPQPPVVCAVCAGSGLILKPGVS